MGKWKLSMGGEGLESSKYVRIENKVCTTDEYSRIYQLNKPVNDNLYMLFTPFGEVTKALGRKSLNEALALKDNIPIMSICFIGEDSIKIKTMNVKNYKSLQSKAAYQVLKFNACRKCYKCESACKFGAISIRNGVYNIDKDICIHCLSCVNPKYIADGCVMKGYLKSRRM